MKITLTLSEGLKAIEEYYKSKGMDVKDVDFCLEKTGRVRNMKFEMTLNEME